jgi:hypothetical protein
MTKSVGSIDRGVRIALGLSLIAAAAAAGTVGLWGYIGVVPLMPAVRHAGL